MRWTQAQLDAYEARRLSPRAQPKRPVQVGSVGQTEGEEGNSGRVHVRVTGFRVRLTDPDNLCPKYFIDCLRYAGLIRDDNPEAITLEVAQRKVDHRIEERTEIEIV